MQNGIQIFLAICGGVVTISAAFAAIYKWLAPAFRLSKRIEVIEKRQEADYKRLQKNEDIDELLLRAVFCLLDVAENDVGESPEDVSRIQRTKADIREYLIQR